MENTLTKSQVIETARKVIEGKAGNAGSYAWLVGAMTIFITDKQADTILKVAVENYGEKK